MRQNLRRVTQVMAFLLFGAVIALGFQNCAGYQASDNPLYLSSEVVCIGLACGQNPDLIGITVAADGSLLVRTPTTAATAGGECTHSEGSNADSYCVDVSGYCESGGYPTTEIWAEVKEGTTVRVPTYKTAATCEDGRFRFLLKLPSTYAHQNLHTLRVTIFGIDSNLAQVANPSGANWHEVRIDSYTQP